MLWLTAIFIQLDKKYATLLSSTLIYSFVMLLFRTLTALSLFLASSYARADGRWVNLGGQRYQVELAQTEESRAHGLMFRTKWQQITVCCSSTTVRSRKHIG